MGYSYRRVGVKGKPRYAAIFCDQRGRRRSAGTFATKREADRAWAAAESDALLGVGRDLRRGKISFAAYVTGTWLPHHQLEASTRQRYGYQIEKYLIPEFGPMRMANVAPAHVREWVTRLRDDDVSASTIVDVKTILSAIFTTALNDQLIGIHPCRGVTTPTVARRPRTIVTPEQFDAIHTAVRVPRWQLFVELDIETGLRWGEITELRVHDFNPPTRMLTVARAVAEINARFRQPGQPRFAVNAYPKDKEWRRVKLSPEIAAALGDHITREQLDRDDLFFALPTIPTKPTAAVDGGGPTDPEGESADLGMTAPNAAGRSYPHGTLTGYNLGACRCAHCRTAAARYRAARRAVGKDSPRLGRTIDTDGHIPRRWFAVNVWNPALTTAGLGFWVRVHDLRHAHASWLLAGGADIETVKERLGHGSLRTTEKYLHTLPDADDTALDALRRTRARTTRECATGCGAQRLLAGGPSALAARLRPADAPHPETSMASRKSRARSRRWMGS
jgi:integrase